MLFVCGSEGARRGEWDQEEVRYGTYVNTRCSQACTLCNFKKNVAVSKYSTRCVCMYQIGERFAGDVRVGPSLETLLPTPLQCSHSCGPEPGLYRHF